MKILFKSDKEIGLQTRSQRGPIGTTWWGQWWLQLLDEPRFVDAVEAGRRIARRGQMHSIELSPGQIKSTIQLWQKPPVITTFSTAAYTEEQWTCIVDLLMKRSAYLAHLLCNRLSEELHARMADASLPLLPFAGQYRCSCGADTGCEHAVAMIYLVAELIDDDPFLLFLIRGQGRAEVVGRARSRWGQPVHPPPQSKMLRHPEGDPTEGFYRLKEDPHQVINDLPLQTPSVKVRERLGFPPFLPEDDIRAADALARLLE